MLHLLHDNIFARLKFLKPVARRGVPRRQYQDPTRSGAFSFRKYAITDSAVIRIDAVKRSERRASISHPGLGL
jgi:hypothetical protein